MFGVMIKSEILLELPRLSSVDREEILDRLWDLEESEAVHADAPTPEERAQLDVALAAFARDPNAGRPWRDALSAMAQRMAVRPGTSNSIRPPKRTSKPPATGTTNSDRGWARSSWQAFARP